MTLRNRILLFSLLAGGISILSLILISNGLFLNQYRNLEEHLLQDDLKRVQAAIERDLTFLSSVAADWGYWDETYWFIKGENPAFAAENLTPTTFEGLGVDVMLFYDANLHRVVSYSVNPLTFNPIPLPPDVDRQVFHALLGMFPLTDDFEQKGLLPTQFGPLLFASRAILRNDALGQPAGLIIVGRYLNDVRVDEWESSTHLSIRVESVENPQLPLAFRSDVDRLSTSTNDITSMNLSKAGRIELISGYMLLPTLRGKDYLVLQISKTPEVYNTGYFNFRNYLLFIGTLSVVMGSLSWIFFNNTITSRLFAIIRAINRFRETRDFSITIPLRGRDELSQLGMALSQMIADLGRYHYALAASERQYREMLQKMHLIAVILDEEGKIIFSNEYFLKLTGWNWQEVLNHDWFERFVLPAERDKRRSRYRQHIHQETIDHQQESWLVTRSGEKRLIFWNNTFIRNPDGSVAGMARIGQDITEARKNEEKIRQHLQESNLLLERLKTLREIDTTITSPQTPAEKMEILLNTIKNALKVDAVNILTESVPGYLLPYASRGFNLAQIMPISAQIEVKEAEEALTRGSPLVINRLVTGELSHWLTSRFSGFVPYQFYAAAPMLVDGKRYGILEVFAHKPCTPSDEWRAFFQTLASQTAIALDHTQMIQDIQRAYQELQQAYRATVEGWSATLELRDKETQGHSERMLELSQRLGRRMGLNEKQLEDLRYGVLLHDIGKMAVPDAILNKPGPLNDDEWEVMRQHPQYAYNLLSQISFLKGAMDVIYCHHERWNGSGYPRGLKGEQIPLYARIFAVVDVWDALTNDRPYRAAWSIDKALAYLHEQAGILFDPQVVEAFVKLIREEVYLNVNPTEFVRS
ncbi:MAG: HD domain-containing protein [Bellilinea sp.]|nr:HD domain-containing protein [Bellilinea sp.]